MTLPTTRAKLFAHLKHYTMMIERVQSPVIRRYYLDRYTAVCNALVGQNAARYPLNGRSLQDRLIKAVDTMLSCMPPSDDPAVIEVRDVMYRIREQRGE